MPSPFSSEYVTSVTTEVPKAVDAEDAAGIGAHETTTAEGSGEGASGRFEYQPERYGLGKPRRVVIRGNIARG